MAQDTGPEYLDAELEQQPLSSGFRLLKLPFEEERENLLHLRSFYQDRGFDGARNQHDWAAGGWLKATGYYWQSAVEWKFV